MRSNSASKHWRKRWRLRRYIRCARTPQDRRAMRRKLGEWRRWRHSYTGTWTLRRELLSPAVRAMLFRLGPGCETRGLSNAAGYRYSGHHHGRYQYLAGTWQRAQGYYRSVTGKRVVGATSVAYLASPAHQDVVTAIFFPAHRGEWACSA